MTIMHDIYRAHTSIPWVADRTILFARHGSHAYGTNIATSDTDYKGVAVPPKEYFHGYLKRFEQAECKDPDSVVYDIRKFCALAADGNPNIIEILWCDERDIMYATSAGEKLLEAKDLFLSKKARHTFSGYAHAQMKRIKGHHRWLVSPPTREPVREDFDLPNLPTVNKEQREAAESLIRKKIESWQVDLEPFPPDVKQALQSNVASYLADMQLGSDPTLWMAAGRTLGISENFLLVVERERLYRTKKQEWDQYQTWLKTRNPARAELERKHGYDSKHAGHLVRLMRMCREILETGKVIVRRPDAEELIAIRAGAWTYEELEAWAEKQDAEMDALYKTSTLQSQPDRNAIDRLCGEIVEEMLR